MQRILTALLLTALIAACSNSPTRTAQVDGFDMSEWQTFQWLPSSSMDNDVRQSQMQSIAADVRQSSRAALEDLGYTRSKSGQPDFYVSYHIALDIERETVGAPSQANPTWSSQPWEGGPVFEPLGADVGAENVDPAKGEDAEDFSVRVPQGVLILDILDGDKQVVWRAWARGALKPLSEAQPELRDSVKTLLSRLPKAKQN